ncbi:hypothetical protein CA51_52110 [Rosistilla oblonga]|nr:hypothetical protein CA51_52110 [Rosistilla oblonga]
MIKVCAFTRLRFVLVLLALHPWCWIGSMGYNQTDAQTFHTFRDFWLVAFRSAKERTRTIYEHEAQY